MTLGTHSPSAPRGDAAADSVPAESQRGQGHAQGHRLWRHGLAWTVALAVLAMVFALYLQPAVLVTLADQVWACFN